MFFLLMPSLMTFVALIGILILLAEINKTLCAGEVRELRGPVGDARQVPLWHALLQLRDGAPLHGAGGALHQPPRQPPVREVRRSGQTVP